MQNDYLDCIAHHGISGQKHGVRNGPPYPLSPKDYSAAEKKANKYQAKSDKYKMKSAKKEAKALKAETKALKYKQQGAATIRTKFSDAKLEKSLRYEGKALKFAEKAKNLEVKSLKYSEKAKKFADMIAKGDAADTKKQTELKYTMELATLIARNEKKLLSSEDLPSNLRDLMAEAASNIGYTDSKLPANLDDAYVIYEQMYDDPLTVNKK